MIKDSLKMARRCYRVVKFICIICAMVLAGKMAFELHHRALQTGMILYHSGEHALATQLRGNTLTDENDSFKAGIQEISYETAIKQKVTNIFYVKVHKTGSTTLQNVLYRFGVSNDLKIAVYNVPYGMPFPDIAKPTYLFETNIGSNGFKPYNLMIDHAVYDDKYPYAYMQTGTKTIATLREPMSYLRSAFSFFGLKQKFGLKQSKDPVQDFLLSNPESFRQKHAKGYTWIKNLQIYSFGYKHIENNNPQFIRNFIENTIDKKIDVMLTLDRFDEGLVLMKRKFNWHTKDIIFKVLWTTGKQRKMPLTVNATVESRMKNIYNNFSLGDFMLYDYFKDKVDRELDEQDSVFQQEVSELREINRNVSQFCSTLCYTNRSKSSLMSISKATELLQHSTSIRPSTHGFHDGFSVSYADCALMSFVTVDYQMAVRVHQFPSACHPTQGPPFISKPTWYPPNHKAYDKKLWCDKTTHAVYSVPWQRYVKGYLGKCSGAGEVGYQ